MSTGETLLIIGAVFIFSLTSVYTNYEILESGNAVTEAKIMNGATALALSYIEDAKRLAFDNATIAGSGNLDQTVLTNPGDLGVEGGEIYPGFDDVDDFHNYNQAATTEFLTYFISASVTYVDTNNMNISNADRTLYKRLTVNVTTPFLQDTVKLIHVFSFWGN